ncbi:hypothetical protein H6771_01595 [Candidatus Peribacteria bacterium]|nr:hypothetical protein [Candidatus Peribacteria bacterium]
MATSGEQSIRALIRRVINWFLFFLGLVAVAVIIYGGYMTIVGGADNSDKKSAGINAIIYAIVGIIIILLSYAIVNTVLTVGSGIEPNA